MRFNFYLTLLMGAYSPITSVDAIFSVKAHYCLGMGIFFLLLTFCVFTILRIKYNEINVRYTKIATPAIIKIRKLCSWH